MFPKRLFKPVARIGGTNIIVYRDNHLIWPSTAPQDLHELLQTPPRKTRSFWTRRWGIFWTLVLLVKYWNKDLLYLGSIRRIWRCGIQPLSKRGRGDRWSSCEYLRIWNSGRHRTHSRRGLGSKKKRKMKRRVRKEL